jgi:hypothetical protein
VQSCVTSGGIAGEHRVTRTAAPPPAASLIAPPRKSGSAFDASAAACLIMPRW